MEATSTAIPQQISDAVDADLHRELWQRIAGRLQRGDALITTEDFLKVLEVEYQAVTGNPVTDTLREVFGKTISSFNRENPERYVAVGVQNCVRRVFESNCFKLDWDLGQIEDVGSRSIARFKSQNLVQDLLRDVNVSTTAIDGDDCVRNAVDVVSERKPRTQKHELDEPLADVDLLEPVASEPEPEPEPIAEETQEALKDGTISDGELQARQAEQDQAHDRLEHREMGRVVERVDQYVQQGYLTTDEGETVRKLHDIDEQQKSGAIDAEEASRLRNSLMTEELRTKLDRKVKGAVDHAVRFLQAFESMQRVSTSIDEALRFLIHHKHILDPERSDRERGLAAQELLEDRELLHLIIEIMERKDHEIRMISVCLPPYSYIVKRGNERIGNLTIEEDFIDDLRELEADDMSDKLHSEDALTRVRPAADMQCLIAILNHLIKATPWRKEVRMMRVQDSLEQFYQETDDLGEARKQAENFLARRLRRMFKDLSNDEKHEIEERGAQMLDNIEEKVIAERQAKADDAATEAAAQSGGAGAGVEDDAELSEDELKKGAVFGRVEMRVAGQMRRVPRKLMLDPDDGETYCLAQRNSDTGELEPVLRRGAKRIVERGTDGLWRTKER
ncbi:MAG: hypothetical protein HOM68_17610 [Gemmatimonadetes bacterium]|nr:hypothetical protein [Gemmatimonadota bacterium]MBT5058364.1 hypothetical protein [Gemmatimonadota bacterium]MBT5141505.1 hypothetical protein [Gemmatimonadota bacterium]MBT5588813.1 hypothetical protein [Gemmatimonadota bacterium]MBT5965127.1 hypothetical protein [Gemmatimonadota bacterium]